MAYSRTLNHFTSMQELATIWASSTSYVVNQLVIENNRLYKCAIAHTSSGSFINDIGSGYWAEVSSSAPGIKNYITNGSFDNNTANEWGITSSTLDPVTKLPNQNEASWGAPSGTLSAALVTSGQLAGIASLSLSSSGATTAGNMLVTDAITLDSEAQASVQTFSFFYRVVSGAANGNFSGTSSNSIGVAIYVVDGSLAGTWIQPAGVWSVNTASSVTPITAKAAGTFQVPVDATQVRLAVYFPNATSGAITVYFDDFVLGPQTVQYGAPVTDWQSYTPTGSWVTNSTYSGKWARVGDSMHLRVRVALSGAPTATALTINLPTGYSIDTTKLNATTNNDALPLSSGSAVVGGAFSTPVIAFYSSVTAVALRTLQQRSTDDIQFDNITSTLPGNFTSGDFVEAGFAVPITGWSSSVVVSSSTDTRVVAASITNGNNATISANNPIRLITSGTDTHGAYSASTGQYTVPVPGLYSVGYALALGAATAGAVFYIYKNGVQQQYIGEVSQTSLRAIGSGLIQCAAGDLIDVRCNNNLTLSATVLNSALFFNRLSGPSQIAASETVAASYWASVNGTATTTTPINFDSREFDTHGSVTTGAGWRFTAPISGIYNFGFVANQTAAATVYWFVYKNGTVYKVLNYATSAFGYNLNCSSQIYLNAGEYIDIRPSVSQAYAGGALSSQNSANFWIRTR